MFPIVPLVIVFIEAFSRGIDAYLDALAEPDTGVAIRLTLLVAAISVPLNTVFRLAA